jgi:hypothetical protein
LSTPPHIFSFPSTNSPLRQELVREVAIEDDALPREKTQGGNARGQLVDEMDVVSRRGGLQQVTDQMQLSEVSEKDVELTPDVARKRGANGVYDERPLWIQFVRHGLALQGY